MTALIAILTLLLGLTFGFIVGRFRGSPGSAAAAGVGDEVVQAASDAVREGLTQLIDSTTKLQRDLLDRNQESAQNQQKSVHDLVQPIDQQLKELGNAINRVEQERASATGTLTQQLENLLSTTQRLNDDTKMLSTALRDTRVRGSWGELQLRRVVELADMMRHCSFTEQVHLAGDDSSLRPDMVINLPDDKVILVDSKVPLNAYLEAMNTDDPDKQHKLLEDHAKAVEQHVAALRNKNYGSSHQGSLGFVIMFVPGDTFLNEAYRIRPSLMAESVERGVLLTTPTALIGLLKAIEAGWRQERLAENAEEIRKLGEVLLGRLGVFVDHLSKVGTNLGRATESYNRAVNSLQTRLLPAARQFEDTGIRSDKDLDAAKFQSVAPILASEDHLALEPGDAEPESGAR